MFFPLKILPINIKAETATLVEKKTTRRVLSGTRTLRHVVGRVTSIFPLATEMATPSVLARRRGGRPATTTAKVGPVRVTVPVLAATSPETFRHTSRPLRHALAIPGLNVHVGVQVEEIRPSVPRTADSTATVALRRVQVTVTTFRAALGLRAFALPIDTTTRKGDTTGLRLRLVAREVQA